MRANATLGVLGLGQPQATRPPDSDFTRRAPEQGGLTSSTLSPSALSPSMISPSMLNIVFGGGLAENLTTQGTVSGAGDVGTGVASGMAMGPERSVLGSFKSQVGVTPTQRLTSQNSGWQPFGLAPAQVRPRILD